MTLPNTAVTNWQAFFKPAPTQHERSFLEQKLSAWKDEGTVKDLIQRGRTEIAVGRLAAAEATLRQALRRFGDDRDVQLELAALYLRRNGKDTHLRLHGTVEPWSIGTNVSSGCIRLINQNVIDLCSRMPVGTRVVVQQT